MTQKQKIILSCVLFTVAAVMVGRFLINEFGPIGGYDVDNLGPRDPAKKQYYLTIKARLQEEMLEARRAGLKPDPKLLADIEKIDTVYLEKNIKKRKKNKATAKADVKTKAATNATPVAQKPTDPKAPPKVAPKAEAKPAPKLEVKKPVAKNTKAREKTESPQAFVPTTPSEVPSAAPSPNADREVVFVTQRSPASVLNLASLEYLEYSGGLWNHTWIFTAPYNLAKNNDISIVAYLYKDNRLASKRYLVEHLKNDDIKKEDLIIQFRIQDSLRFVNQEESNLYYRVSSSNKRLKSKNTVIKLKHMNRKKFYINRGNISFSTKGEDVAFSKSLFQLKGESSDPYRLIVRMEVGGTGLVAH